MKSWVEIAVPIMLTFLLLAPVFARADAQNGGEIVVQPVINFDLDSLVKSIGQNANTIGGAIGGIPDGVLSVFRKYIEETVASLDTGLLSFLKEMTLSNPDPDSMKALSGKIVGVISVFYALAFLATALAFVAAGSSAYERAKAKQWLKNSVMMVIGVNVAFPLYKLLLEISAALTNYFWTAAPGSFFDPSFLSGAGLGPLLLFAVAVSFACFTLFLRHIFLLIGACIFPLGIFLYFFSPARGWGLAIFELLGAAMLMQIVDAFIFAAAANVGSGSASGTTPVFIAAFAFLLVGIMNVCMVLYAFFRAGGAVVSAGEDDKALNMTLNAMKEGIAVTAKAATGPSEGT